jgi:hypothetical protein
VQKKIDGIRLPEGMKVALGGVIADMTEGFSSVLWRCWRPSGLMLIGVVMPVGVQSGAGAA